MSEADQPVSELLEARLLAWKLGELTPEESVDVESLIEHSAPARAALQRLEDTLDLVGDMLRAHPPQPIPLDAAQREAVTGEASGGENPAPAAPTQLELVPVTPPPETAAAPEPVARPEAEQVQPSTAEETPSAPPPVEEPSPISLDRPVADEQVTPEPSSSPWWNAGWLKVAAALILLLGTFWSLGGWQLFTPAIDDQLIALNDAAESTPAPMVPAVESVALDTPAPSPTMDMIAPEPLPPEPAPIEIEAKTLNAAAKAVVEVPPAPEPKLELDEDFLADEQALAMRDRVSRLGGDNFGAPPGASSALELPKRAAAAGDAPSPEVALEPPPPEEFEAVVASVEEAAPVGDAAPAVARRGKSGDVAEQDVASRASRSPKAAAEVPVTDVAARAPLVPGKPAVSKPVELSALAPAPIWPSFSQVMPSTHGKIRQAEVRHAPTLVPAVDGAVPLHLTPATQVSWWGLQAAFTRETWPDEALLDGPDLLAHLLQDRGFPNALRTEVNGVEFEIADSPLDEGRRLLILRVKPTADAGTPTPVTVASVERMWTEAEWGQLQRWVLELRERHPAPVEALGGLKPAALDPTPVTSSASLLCFVAQGAVEGRDRAVLERRLQLGRQAGQRVEVIHVDATPEECLSVASMVVSYQGRYIAAAGLDKTVAASGCDELLQRARILAHSPEVRLEFENDRVAWVRPMLSRRQPGTARRDEWWGGDVSVLAVEWQARPGNDFDFGQLVLQVGETSHTVSLPPMSESAASYVEAWNWVRWMTGDPRANRPAADAVADWPPLLRTALQRSADRP